MHLLTGVLFAGLVWSSVIPWNFRWYGLAIFLALQAVGGLWTLVRSAKEEGSASKMNILLRSTISLLLTFCAISPALIFPTYRPLTPTGNYIVATARYTYTDEHRMEQFAANGLPRKVNCSCWYPENTPRGATFPLIIFSHGGLGLETSNESLFLELASHGYVICSIGHPFHAFWTKSTDGQTAGALQCRISAGTLSSQSGIFQLLFEGSATCVTHCIQCLPVKWLTFFFF